MKIFHLQGARGLRLGDTFTVKTPKRDFKYKIVGLGQISALYQTIKVLN